MRTDSYTDIDVAATLVGREIDIHGRLTARVRPITDLQDVGTLLRRGFKPRGVRDLDIRDGVFTAEEPEIKAALDRQLAEDWKIKFRWRKSDVCRGVDIEAGEVTTECLILPT